MRSNFAVPWRTPSRGQGWRCCRGPRTHVWRRHVDCVGRICVQVPRPTDDAQMRADSTSSAEREQSRPAGATARSHGSTAVESPVELPPSPQGSFLTLAFDAPHCERLSSTPSGRFISAQYVTSSGGRARSSDIPDTRAGTNALSAVP
jgi:hypothetical protein